MKQVVLFLLALLGAAPAWAEVHGKHFDRVVFVIFENTDYADALRAPFFAELARKGALLTNFSAATHPSQGNYMALTSGTVAGVQGDADVDLPRRSLPDLLEAKGLDWKVYAEDYPGNCFAGNFSRNYVRKHNPFISYDGIRRDPARCARIVNAREFADDVRKGTLPAYSFYVPHLKNDGHDTGVAFADTWYRGAFAPLLAAPVFQSGTLLVSTFDESNTWSTNHIYTSLVGAMVKPGAYASSLNHYSLLRLVEDNWDLGTLGEGDATATALPELWLP